MKVKRERQLATYRKVCRKGTDWLLNFMNQDGFDTQVRPVSVGINSAIPSIGATQPKGSIGPVQERLCYYRVPCTFALMGEIAAASQLLDWIHRHMLSPEGAFEGSSPQGVFESRHGSYPLACLIIGAALLQRFDIVYPGTRHLLTWQDRKSGGFYNNLKNTTATGLDESKLSKLETDLCNGTLSTELQKEFERAGYKFILHGHLHRAGILRPMDPDSNTTVIAAGACYESRDYPNTYNFVRLNFETGKGTVYLRRYSDKRGGFWTKDVMTYRNVRDGEHVFDLPVKSQAIETMLGQYLRAVLEKHTHLDMIDLRRPLRLEDIYWFRLAPSHLTFSIGTGDWRRREDFREGEKA
ncbi:MAG: hypothetical protein H8D67_04385 [Deltaproteobacteria bacterium]|nr:hypothetical protein [Deltaproteobacteria bacterium]